MVSSFFLSVFLLSYYLFLSICSQPSQIGCLPYFHTWCGLSVNLGRRSEMCCMRLAENTGHKKSPSGHHHTTLSGCIFTTKASIDNRKKLIKQQYLLHMSPQDGELWPSNGWDRFTTLGHPTKFQRVSHLVFVTAAEANQTLHDDWPSHRLVHYIYIFRGSCPLREFCHVQNSLYVQVLGSLIFATLLHGTPAVGVSQTLWRGTRNGITELS